MQRLGWADRRRVRALTALALVLSAATSLAALQPGGAWAAAGGRTQDVVIESQDFEGGTFPPPGWAAFDSLNDPAEFQWDRETCQVEPGVGGSRSVWALGGGSGGAGLSCGAEYVDPVDTALIYGPIDTTGFPGGLRVSMRVWLDIPDLRPDAEAFMVCANPGPSPEQPVSCWGTGRVESGWEEFAPLDFPLSTGLTDVYVWIYYFDRMPEGGHVGVFVDNIVIEGVGGSGGSTPTPTTPTSATPTGTPSRTATGTATASDTPTATLGPGTMTATRTSTPTATRTGTTSPTITPEASASVTATRTATGTASVTGTATATATTGSATDTRTPGVSPSAGVTATGTQVSPTVSAEPSEEGTPPSDTFDVYLPMVTRRS